MLCGRGSRESGVGVETTTDVSHSTPHPHSCLFTLKKTSSSVPAADGDAFRVSVRLDSGEDARRVAAAEPARARRVREDHRLRGRAGQRRTERRRGSWRRATPPRAPGAPTPRRERGGRADGREPDINDDELEAGRADHLGRGHRLFHRLRPHPQQPAADRRRAASASCGSK